MDDEIAEWIQKDFKEKYNKNIFFISALKKDDRMNEVLREVACLHSKYQSSENQTESNEAGNASDIAEEDWQESKETENLTSNEEIL